MIEEVYKNMWFTNNRKEIREALIDNRDWSGIAISYRDKSCVIYVAEGYSDLYVDVGWVDEFICADSSKYEGAERYKGECQVFYAMINYLEITKIFLRKNKGARRFLNKVVKNNFYYNGKPFKEYFFADGQVNWDLVLETTGISTHTAVIWAFMNEIPWGRYDPFRNNHRFDEPDPEEMAEIQREQEEFSKFLEEKREILRKAQEEDNEENNSD